MAKSNRISAADLPRRYQDQVAQQLGKAPPAVVTSTVVAAKGRVRQSSKPLLNKLETDFQSFLATKYLEEDIFPQAVRLELARGHWFKPDFLLLDTMTGLRPTFYEVKGPHAFRGGFENLKVAARRYQFFKFILVWRDEGVWKEQHILP